LPTLGQSLAVVATLSSGEKNPNIIVGRPGETLPAGASVVQIFLTRSDPLVTFNVTIGGANVYPDPGPANINAVLGTLPSTQDDEVITVVSVGGDKIVIAASNTNAGDQEARALIKITPIDDQLLVQAARARGK